MDNHRLYLSFVAGLRSFGAGDLVLDPAVGGGVFLLAAGEAMPGGRAERVERLRGFDIDPVAVATTRAALALWSGGTEPALDAVRVADGGRCQSGVLL